MTKIEFLAGLREGLSGLPQEDIEERVCFYCEMIDDRIEEGVDEAAAIEALGSVEAIVEQTIAEIPLSRLVKKKIKEQKRMSAWEIVLLAVGSPLWITLLAVAFAIVLSFYAVLWSVVAVFWAVFAALAAVGVGWTGLSVVLMATDSVFWGLAVLGVGLFAAGLAIFSFFGCIAATKGSAILSKKVFLGIKRLFVRKEKKHA